MVGFPHSEIPGSKLIRSSPRLIAAYYVLHRLHTPRHPLDALKTLDRSHYQCPQYHQPHLALVFQLRSPSSGRCIPTHHCIGFDRSDQKKPFFTHKHCSSPRVSGQTDSTVSLHDVQRSGRGRFAASTQPNLLLSSTRFSKWDPSVQSKQKLGGARRDRTDDILLAKQALSQLSYGPIWVPPISEWWARVDSNYRPHAYQACALTT